VRGGGFCYSQEKVTLGWVGFIKPVVRQRSKIGRANAGGPVPGPWPPPGADAG